MSLHVEKKKSNKFIFLLILALFNVPESVMDSKEIRRKIAENNASPGNYVYITTDISKEMMVGPRMLPFLKGIPMDDTGVYRREYDRLHFIPITSKSINEVKVNIVNHKGEFLDCTGVTTVGLVLKRI